MNLDQHIAGPYLFRTHYGSVLRCACCGRFELRFVDTHMILTDVHFRAMRQAVQRLEQCRKRQPEIGRWRLTTYEGGEAHPVEFSAVDVQRLYELLEGTAAVIELDRLLAGCSIAVNN